MIKVGLADGRIFKAEDILSISFDDTEKVYKYEIKLQSQIIKSSKGHEWMVWDSTIADVKMVRTDEIDLFKHYIIIQEQSEESE